MKSIAKFEKTERPSNDTESISSDASSVFRASIIDQCSNHSKDDEKNFDTLNEKRLRALNEIDNAKFGWFHIRACLVAGVGFFTDAYDLFSINLVAIMLGYAYEKSHGNRISGNIELALKISAGLGTFFGQLVFGILADQVGRKKMYGVELWTIVFCTITSALSGSGPRISVYALIIFWRFILGVGVGGDYPLSAIITSEFATAKNRGAMMATVFAMQGFGILTSIIVAIVTLAAFKKEIREDQDYIDYVWRIVLGMGALPGIIALYFRLTIPETPRYRMDVERDITGAITDIDGVLKNLKYNSRPSQIMPRTRANIPVGSWSDFKNYFGQWKNGKILLGTCGAWFCIDVAFYGIGLNNTTFLHELKFVLPGDSQIEDPWTSLWNVSIGNILLTLLGTVPGYWFTVFFIDRWGRKPIQYMGFALLTLIFLALGLWYNQIKKTSSVLFGLMFTLAQFFCNFGPNATTFVLPGEVFPTRYRSTGYGIAAASGKLGAITAQVIFSKLKNLGGSNKSSNRGLYDEKDAFVDKLFLLCSLFMVLGFGFTYLIPETKGKTLEQLSNERQDIFIRRSGELRETRQFEFENDAWTLPVNVFGLNDNRSSVSSTSKRNESDIVKKF
ncbi:hypothetical protein G9A89_011472 [Geosiphon pyriformis]|nr:hypothetical protein G9A89_011472 [Geosiphon pyriformis]